MVTVIAHPPTLGRWLKRLRAQQDLTQEALAERANCSVQTIRFFESGKRRPSVGMAEHLATILQIPADELAAFISVARTPLMQEETKPSPLPADEPSPDPPPALQPISPLLQPARELIGRASEANILTRLLTGERHRLVSLTGMGGMGKTHLALHLAHSLQSHFADGAAFVPLASLTRVDEIPAAIAKAMGVPLPQEVTKGAQLDALLQDRMMLLVLDNVEQLLNTAGWHEHVGEADLIERNIAGDICALIGHIVQYHPGISLLVTTRERLRLAGERVFELDGLTLTPAGAPINLAENEALLLFAERAAQVAPGFALTPANQATIWQICRLLEGAPLAIELAAAWSHVLAPQEIAEEITRGIDFLARSDRNAPARHRSLRSIFDQSWAFLTEEERQVMSWLAAFRGGFSRQAACTVTTATLPLLAQLVDRSLIRVFMEHHASGEQSTRYYIHNLLRAYLVEKLAARGDSMAAARQHATFFTRLADQREAAFYTGKSLHELQQLQEEQPNLRAALEWSLREGNDPPLGLQLAGALGRFWQLSGQWAEGTTWLQLALPHAPAASALTARAEIGAGMLYHLQEQYTAAAAHLQRGLAAWRAVGDVRQIAWSYFQLGSLSCSQGDYEQAQQALSESLTRYRSVQDQWAIATVLNQMSAIASSRGDYVTAARLLDESLPLLRAQGTPGGLSVALNLLGRILLGQGEVERAISLFHEALEISQRRQSLEGEAWTWLNLGLGYLAVEELHKAKEAFHANLRINQELKRQGGLMAAQEGLAAVAAAAGLLDEARQRLAEAARLRAQSGQPLTAYELAIHERTVAMVEQPAKRLHRS